MSPLNNLKNKIYITKNARFNAHARLLDEQTRSSFCLMVVSAYMIVASVYPILLNPVPSSQFWSLFLSIFLLGISSIEGGLDRREQAKKLHSNAVLIEGIHKKIIQLDDSQKTELANLADEYSKILGSCDCNHSPIDYYQAKYRDTDLSRWGRFKAFSLYCNSYVTSTRFLYLAFAVTPPIIFIIMHA